MALRLAAFLAAVLLCLAAGTARAERIRSFDTEVALAKDGAFTVQEKIRWDFEGERRHGIFRDLPVRYGRGRAPDYRIAVDVEAVTDARGNPRPFTTRRQGRDLRIRIGDPDATVTGLQDYWIRYRVRRGILWLEGHDELYWNATGTEWPVPIDAARATVTLPAVGAGEVETACYTGPQGAVASDCAMRLTPGMASFETEHPLGVREGLTLVLGLPKGVLEEPSRLERALARTSDFVSAWMLVPLLAFAGMLSLWRRSGRDRGGRDALPVRYEPPEGLTPAEVGTVLDEKADLSDITASVLDLAVRGFLTIEERESERFLFLKDRDWILRKRAEPKGLRRHESILFHKLFAGRDEVTLSSLKNQFYQHLPEIRDALYAQVSREDGFFPTNPEKVRRSWALAGGALAVFGFVSFAVGEQTTPALCFGAAGAIVLAFSRVMPRRTRRGRRAYEEIRGFQEFVERVDADRLERMGGRTAERFERILPFAVVLGVADAWAQAFAGLYTQPPAWFHSADGRSFAPRHFVSDVGRSLDAMGSTLSSRPGGSGSSGLGGGGFSGGGFGGGGGGSW